MSCGYCTAPGGKCKGDCNEARAAGNRLPAEMSTAPPNPWISILGGATLPKTQIKPPHAPRSGAQQRAIEDAYQRGYREGFRDGVTHVTSTRAPAVQSYACVRRPRVKLSAPCECDACELPYGP